MVYDFDDITIDVPNKETTVELSRYSFTTPDFTNEKCLGHYINFCEAGLDNFRVYKIIEVIDDNELKLAGLITRAIADYNPTRSKIYPLKSAHENRALWIGEHCPVYDYFKWDEDPAMLGSEIRFASAL